MPRDEAGRISELESRSPGEEPHDPYRSVDVSQLPAWWRRAIAEWEEYDLRPYRPPRFEDGVFLHEVRKRLEEQYGIDLRFVDFDPTGEPGWTVYANGDAATKVEYHRSPSGYTVFDLSSDEFESRIHSHVADSHDP